MRAAVHLLTDRELAGLDPDQVEVGVLLVCDKAMRRYNRRYRGRDKATNVLSFALNDGEKVAQPAVGDLILSFQTIRREAKARDKSFEAHLAHLLVHGVLHLFGHDHERSRKAARRQEAREVAILAEMGYGHPYR